VGEPFAAGREYLGVRSQLADHRDDLRGPTLAFHGQRPAECERGFAVEVLGAFGGIHRGAGDGGTSLQRSASAC
jgi:hypothetical protein